MASAWRQTYEKRDPRNPARTRTMYRIMWRDPLSGSKKSKSFETAKAAEKFLLDKKVELQSGPSLERPPVAFGEYAGVELVNGRVELTGSGWYAQYKTQVSPGSYRTRVTVLQHLAPFVATRLDWLTAEAVKRETTRIAAQHPRTGKRFLETVKMILREARVDGHRVEAAFLAHPKQGGIKNPRYAPKPKRFLLPAEVVRLCAIEDADADLIRFAVETGLRPGEVCGLKPSDIRDGKVYVTHTLSQLRYGPVKTKASVRSFKLTREAQAAARRKLLQRADAQAPYLFLQHNGRRKGEAWDTNNLARRFAKWCDAANIEGVTPHDMRHTFASWAIKAGAHPKVIQEIMGHDSINVTMDEYGHLFEGSTDAAIDAMERMLQKEAAQ